MLSATRQAIALQALARRWPRVRPTEFVSAPPCPCVTLGKQQTSPDPGFSISTWERLWFDPNKTLDKQWEPLMCQLCSPRAAELVEETGK